MSDREVVWRFWYVLIVYAIASVMWIFVPSASPVGVVLFGGGLALASLTTVRIFSERRRQRVRQ